MLLAVSAAVVFFALASSTAIAATINSVTITVEEFQYSAQASDDGNGIWRLTGNLFGDGWSLDGFQAMFDTDPQLQSSGTFTNTTNHAIPYAIGFFLTLPPGIYSSPTAKLTVSVTNPIDTNADTVNMSNTINGGTSTGADINSSCFVAGSGTNSCVFSATGMFLGHANSMETNFSGNMEPGTFAFSGAFNLNLEASDANESGTMPQLTIGGTLLLLLVLLAKRRRTT